MSNSKKLDVEKLFSDEELSKRIRDLISNDYNSLKQASEKYNIQYTHFTAMLNSSRPISKDLLFALAKEGYSLDYIIHGVGSPYLKFREANLSELQAILIHSVEKNLLENKHLLDDLLRTLKFGGDNE